MNSKWHLYTSLAKSFIRIVGCVLSLQYSQPKILAISFGVAELLGVFEELGDKR